MSEPRIVEALRAVGLNATEARTYLALLLQHPATGYEIAARSEVPRSAIYKVLRRLEELGLVNAAQQKPQKFVPLPPEKLYALLASRFERSLGELKESLVELRTERPDAVTWTVRGYDSMLEEARRLVRDAQRSVHASIWRREALALASVLHEAKRRGLDLVLFSFTELPGELGRVFAYGIEESELEAHWQHKLILITDGAHLLVGASELGRDNRCVLTDEPAMIEIAGANVTLDLTLYGQRTGEPVREAILSLPLPHAPIEELLERTADRRKRS